MIILLIHVIYLRFASFDLVELKLLICGYNILNITLQIFYIVFGCTRLVIFIKAVPCDSCTCIMDYSKLELLMAI